MQWPLLWEDPTCSVLILCRESFSRREISAQLATTWGQALCCPYPQTRSLVVREVRPVRVVLMGLSGTGKINKHFKNGHYSVKCCHSFVHGYLKILLEPDIRDLHLEPAYIT